MIELSMALIAPTFGGVISIFIWFNKRNSENVQKSFDLLYNSTQKIERKVDEISLDVAKNYVTNDDMRAHMKAEEAWHKVMREEVRDIKTDVKGTREVIDRILIDDNFLNK